MKTRDQQIGKSDNLSVDLLLLDSENPRFGELTQNAEQKDIVDLIVKNFGVEDVISSLAMNGFFAAEPLICRPKGDGKFVVVEGNRRLTACLIILGDDRASAFGQIGAKYRSIWEANGSPKIEPLPVIIFSDSHAKKELLSYLGVRHISAAQPWDSYAKAAWVRKIIDETGMNVSDIVQMIGDQNNTVMRLLEGYNFVRQLVETGYFDPRSSVRKGRGSVTEYPFSWAYTLLGYKSARDFVGLGEITQDPNPLDESKLESGALLLQVLFGNSNIGRNSAIADSRQISALARTFSSPDKVSMLRSGRSVEQIENLTKPIERRLVEGLSDVRGILSNLLEGLLESPPDIEIAQSNIASATKNRNLASEIEKKLRTIVLGDE